MLTKERKAEIARANGAKSIGPKTDQGKQACRRNAITHGRRATSLAPFVPPDSALLKNEDRQNFYRLFDQNLAKYQPNDPAETLIVREITEYQWVNFRISAARHGVLNRELELHGHNTGVGAATALAYESAERFKAMAKLRQELMANTRLIIQLERRLLLVQKNWPEFAEQTEPAPVPVEAEAPKQTDAEAGHELPDGSILIVYEGEWTQEVFDFYKNLYPNHDLTFRYAHQTKAM